MCHILDSYKSKRVASPFTREPVNVSTKQCAAVAIGNPVRIQFVFISSETTFQIFQLDAPLYSPHRNDFRWPIELELSSRREMPQT
jgi:hypothetical protein